MKRMLWVVLIAGIVGLVVMAFGPERVAGGLDGVADRLDSAADSVRDAKVDPK